jgi:ATP-dependent protease ClpP protease subunit
MIRTPSNVAALRAAWRATQVPHLGHLPCFQVSNSGHLAKVYVSGLIGGFDLDAQEFVQAVHGIKAKQIDLHVNSPGGFVWDAVAMHEALRAHPARVVTHVDGLAASAASFLALAGDEVETAKGSRWMVHDAQVVAIGSPAELREAADLGDAVSDDIAGIYAARAGGKPAAWRKAMTATTWYSAEQAVDAGLAHRLSGSGQQNSGASNRSRLIKARAAVALGGVVK